MEADRTGVSSEGIAPWRNWAKGGRLEVAGERRDSVLTGSSLGTGARLEVRRDKWKERLNTQLLRAVRTGDLENITRLLEEGASPGARCRRSLITACHLAAAHGRDTVLRYLFTRQDLDPGGLCEMRDRAGRQPHHLAAATGHLVALQAILTLRPDIVHSQIQPGPGTGHLPSGSLDSWNHNHHEYDRLVPEAMGIGRTALHLASDRGNWKIVELLLAFGASTNVPDMNGLLALDVAGQHYIQNTVLCDIQDLRSNVKNTDVDGSKNDTTGSVERVCGLLMGSGAELPRAKVIVKDGVVINQRRMKVTALHTAVALGDLHLVQFLLSSGACPLTWNEEGLTAGALAVRGKSEAGLRALLESEEGGTAREGRDIHGRTPLLHAVESGWEDGVAILLEAGADVCVTSNSNMTVLHLAALHGRTGLLLELLSMQEIYKILDRTNSNHETPLCLAVKGKHLECVKELCRRGADSNFLLLPGDQSLLHIAVSNNSVEILQVLLSGAAKSRINLRTKDEKGGVTPLHTAAYEGYLDCTEEILGMGADPGLRTKKGDTPLHLAARAGHVHIVHLLIRHDPTSMESRNSDGWNPLHIAAAEGNTACAKEMIVHGADMSATIDYEAGERTAIDIIGSSIPKSAEFLEETFNEFVEVIKGPINDPDCEILMNYEVLIPSGENEKQLRVIGALMNCGRQTITDRIMLHPLVETFLYLKWNKYKFFFIFVMMLYLVLTLSLTTIAHLTFVEKNITNLHKAVSIFARVMLLSVLIPIIFVEIVNLSQLQRYYFMDYESWVKWIVIVFTCVVESVTPSYFWVRYVASVAVLMSWIEMLFLLSRCPTWGFYVLMFSRVAIKISKVLATFSFLIIGFAFSFLILFQAGGPFRNMLEAVVKVIVMMIEFDYEDMFDGSPSGDLFSIVGRLMFAAFVLLVAMVMMNLIVGVAVSDISRLEEQGRTQQLAKQAGFLTFLERFLYSKRLQALPKSWMKALHGRRSVQRTVVIKPCRPSRSEVHLPRLHIDNILYNLKTRHITNANVTASLRNISEGIDNIAQALRDFYANQQKSPMFRSSKQFEHILTLILEEQKAIRERIEKQIN